MSDDPNTPRAPLPEPELGVGGAPASPQSDGDTPAPTTEERRLRGIIRDLLAGIDDAESSGPVWSGELLDSARAEAASAQGDDPVEGPEGEATAVRSRPLTHQERAERAADQVALDSVVKPAAIIARATLPVELLAAARAAQKDLCWHGCGGGKHRPTCAGLLDTLALYEEEVSDGE